MNRTVRSEIRKIRSTQGWWLTGLAILTLTAFALLSHVVIYHFGDLASSDPALRSPAALAVMAGTLYTSGQFLGVLLVMLFAAGLITNEYAHHTITSTFLATPRRSQVVMAKLAVAGLLGLAVGLLTSAIGIGAGVAFLHSEGLPSRLGEWNVAGSVLLGLAAYVVWAVLGVGLGALLRRKTATIVTGALIYLVGSAVLTAVFELIHQHLIRQDWILTARVIVPSIASQVMTTPGGRVFDQAPSQWVGACVLIGYGLIAIVTGTFVVRRQDIT